jgi:hypothetical protein
MAGYLERLKSLKTGTQGTAKTAKSPFYSKCSDGGRHISEMIPAPEPPGLGPVYAELWDAAWKLADEIDNPQGTPIEDRRALMPELNELRERMAAIEKAGVVSHETPAPDPAGTWTPWESSGSTREQTADTCPARDKATGKCYAAAYYQGKPGKAKDCEPDGCQNKCRVL